MSINKDNFLRWNGTFNPKPWSITPGFSVGNLFANQDFCVVNPFSGTMSATLGIDTYSFEITRITNASFVDIELSSPCEYDGVSALKVYRPLDISVTVIVIFFKFTDILGNTIASSSFVQIGVSTIYVSWVSYPPSATCSLDAFGNNNGKLEWSQLKLINTGTGTAISPLTLKDNVPSDADYIAPITDFITCPVIGVGDYSPLVISNFSKNGSDPANYITITNVFLSSSNLGPGGTPITLNINCNIAPGQSQRFNVPAILWDNGLTLSYGVIGNMVTASPQRQWRSNKSGTIDDFPTGGTRFVDNSGIYGNFTITIPSNSDGVIIFAQ